MNYSISLQKVNWETPLHWMDRFYGCLKTPSLSRLVTCLPRSGWVLLILNDTSQTYHNPWAAIHLSAMKTESGMFFHRLIQNNEPVNRLIDANFSFLNEEFAKH